VEDFLQRRESALHESLPLRRVRRRWRGRGGGGGGAKLPTFAMGPEYGDELEDGVEKGDEGKSPNAEFCPRSHCENCGQKKENENETHGKPSGTRHQKMRKEQSSDYCVIVLAAAEGAPSHGIVPSTPRGQRTSHA
jgi:hypothetical protein